MSDGFGVGRMVLWLIEIIGWAAVALGVVWFLMISGERGISSEVFAPLGAVLGGLIQIAIAQLARAQIETAANTRRMVELLSGGQARPAVQPVSGSGSLPFAGSEPGSVIKHYKGRAIVRTAEGVCVEGENLVFVNVIEAERHIDGR